MRDKFTQTPPLAISELMLDVENPRTGVLASQSEAIHMMLTGNAGKKIVLLAEDIARRGLGVNPIVVLKNDDGRYVVKDGNRRTAALKLLGNPNLASDPLYKNKFISIKREAPNGNIPSTVVCLEAPDLQSALDHMELDHNGEQEGIGHVDWGTYEKGNFAELTGGKPSERLARAIRKLLEDEGFLDVRQAPLTNLSRLFSPAATQSRIGFSWDPQKGSISFVEPRDKVISILKAIVADFASGSKNVNDIYHEEDRQKYLDEFFVRWETLQSTQEVNTTTISQAISPSSQQHSTTTPDLSPVHGPAKPPRSRKRLIQRGKSLPIPTSETKMCSILYELEKTVAVPEAPVACAVLVRCLFERTIEYYIERNHIAVPNDQKSQSLNGKIRIVINHLQSRKVLNSKEAKERERLVKNEEFISAKTLHSWVHSPTATPSSDAVCTWWDDNYVFLRKCWEN